MKNELECVTHHQAPEPDWSLARETVLMLELAACQVEAAMRDSNSSVDVLAETFTSLADTLELVEAAVDTLPDTIGNGLVKAEIQADTRLVAKKVHDAVVAFQFYDRLIQRLEHVCRGLGGLARLVADRQRIYDPAAWKALQDEILSHYTMVDERAMFAAVLSGASVKEALEQYMQTRRQEIRASAGEIELF